MGFSCFGCCEPFEGGAPASENGGGDGHRPTRNVSVIAKCGHIFHSDCLKKHIQSGNAWTAKSCPVCKVQFNTLQDEIRVHANQFDTSSDRRSQLEQLTIANKKLGEQYNGLFKRSEMLREQIRAMELEREAERREKEDLVLRMDHFVRWNSIHQADVERYKAENDKLKNIIITMTERITSADYSNQEYCGSAPIGNGMNSSNMCRLEYTEDLKRVLPTFDSSSVMTQNINGSLAKPIHHHPPGFMYPPMSNGADNGSDYQDSDRASQAFSISPEIQKPIENGGMVFPRSRNSMTLPIDTHQQARKTPFAFQDVQVRDYDTSNRNNAAEEIALKKSIDLSSKDSATTLEATKSNKNGNLASPGINEKIKKVEIRDDVGDDNLDKWHEKKSRRRGSSGNGRDRRTSGKFEHKSERQLLLYGSFKCPKCHAVWGSSQTLPDTPQTCRYCRTEVHPYDQGPILSRKQLEMNAQSSNSTSKVAANGKKNT